MHKGHAAVQLGRSGAERVVRYQQRRVSASAACTLRAREPPGGEAHGRVSTGGLRVRLWPTAETWLS
jgi:hypothetical protein